MTGQLGGVSPLENIRTHRVRDKQHVNWIFTKVELALQGLADMVQEDGKMESVSELQSSAVKWWERALGLMFEEPG